MARIPAHTIEDAPGAAKPLRFAYLGLTIFTSYFLNYAATELNAAASPARAGEGA